ncbi:MAG: RsmE family RNA methyltransferase [Verrucomicrobiota bacterium]
MHRFYLPPSQTQDNPLTLCQAEAHHALHVLRVRERERAVVLDGAGHELLCEVRQLGKETVTLEVVQKQRIPPLPYRITLAQAVTKSKTMDLIVQKATELGVHRLIPIMSERSVSQIEEDAVAGKLEKWRSTTIEAMKQCGSPWLPQIEAPQTAQKFLSEHERFELALVASLQPNAKHPREHFLNFAMEQQRLPQSVCVWVGPEGDFTPAEMNAIRQSGALTITLGPLILRSETAAIYCLSVLNYELQAPAKRS